MVVMPAVALAAVFAVSGAAKLVDRAATAQAVTGFGVPTRMVAYVAKALAPVELLVALLLVVPATRTVGLVLALGLLVSFTAAVGLALRAGRRPDCQCFGRIGGADISARTVARNLVLVGLAVAGLAAATGLPPASALQAREPAALHVGGGLLLAGLVLLAEWLAGRAAQRRMESLAATAHGSAEPGAPRFTLPTLAGGEMSLDDLLAPGLPLLLVTLSPGCGPCRALRPDIARWAEVLHANLTVAVLATGDRESNLAAYDGMPHLTVLLDDHRVREELGTDGTPSAVVLGPDGVRAGGVAVGEQLVRRLLASTLAGREVGDGPAAADRDGPGRTPADDLDLTSVVGPRTGLEAHPAGGSTVLLDPATGATVALDRIGALVWSVLDGRSSIREIVGDLADAFGAPVEAVGPDVLALVRALGRAGLLEGVAAGQSPAPAPR